MALYDFPPTPVSHGHTKRQTVFPILPPARRPRAGARQRAHQARPGGQKEEAAEEAQGHSAPARPAQGTVTDFEFFSTYLFDKAAVKVFS